MQRLYSKPLVNTIVLNVSIVGMNGSGKSALLVKYLTRRFIVEYAPYLSDSYTKTDSIDGQEVTLNVQDTSDSDDMDLEDILKWSQAIIVLFSITSRRSFYRAQELIENLKQTCNSSATNRASALSPQRQSMHTSSTSNSATTSPLVPSHTGSLRRSAVYGTTALQPPTLILVANKSDLDRFRLVEKMEAEEFAKRHGIPYYETTAAETYQEVQSVFHSVVRLSPVGRLLKSRGPNGVGTTLAARSLASSPSNISSGTGSVLSSLAVSPGLLLQKKSTLISSTPTGQNDATLSVQNESDQSSIGGPVSKLTNLRFRAASPPTFTKNLRSPSPAWSIGRSPSESGPHSNSAGQTAHVTTTNAAQPGQLGTPILTSPTAPPNSLAISERSTRATTPGSTNRVSLTSQNLKVVQPASDKGATNKPVAGPSMLTSVTSRAQPQVVQQQQQPQPPPPLPPPLPPKKIPMSFRFFSKKSK